MQKPRIVAGNWKMNLRLQAGIHLADEIVRGNRPEDVQCILAPPFIHLPLIARKLEQHGIGLAAQNCYEYSTGPYTGEISPDMLQSAGVAYVIVGHSERRLHFQESNALLYRKSLAVFEAGLIPIFCCGEPLEVRQQGKEKAFVEQQLEESLFPLSAEYLSQIIIAYEPVWAIGTGHVASPDQAQEMHVFIRDKIRSRIGDASAAVLPILYGGSVKPDNASGLFAMEDINGALVGGASLVAKDFLEIMASFPNS
jgi:triosephosphate isomerase